MEDFPTGASLPGATNPADEINIETWAVPCSANDMLRQASFRGIPFYVATDELESGRRIATHEFPNRDDPLQEDLGQKQVTYKVKGYIYGALAEKWRDTLVLACASPKAADLILPTMDATKVVCVSVSASRSTEKLGWFDLSFEFRATAKLGLLAYVPAASGYEGQQLGVIYSSTLLGTIRNYYHQWLDLDWSLTGLLQLGGVNQNLIDLCNALVGDGSGVSLAYQLGAIVEVPLAGLLHSVQGVESFITANATGRVLGFATNILLIMEGFKSGATDTVLSLLDPAAGAGPPMYLPDYLIASRTYNPPTAASLVVRDATGLLATADAYNGLDPATGGVRVDHLTLVGGIIANLGVVFDPRDAVVILKNLVLAAPVPPVTTFTAPSDVIDANCEFLFSGGIRRLALVQLAKVYCSFPFKNRAEAISARAYLAEAFYQEALNLSYGNRGSDAGVAAAMSAARDIAIKSIADRMTNLAATATITAPASMPALYYAARLYGDPERAAELADRNDVFDPMFMPGVFIALTK